MGEGGHPCEDGAEPGLMVERADVRVHELARVLSLLVHGRRGTEGGGEIRREREQQGRTSYTWARTHRRVRVRVRARIRAGEARRG